MLLYGIKKQARGVLGKTEETVEAEVPPITGLSWGEGWLENEIGENRRREGMNNRDTTVENGLPVIDLKDYLSGQSASRGPFVADLCDAYETIGFVGVKGHGVEESLVRVMYEAAWRFVGLPDEVKARYHRADLFGQRGYTPKLQEHAKGASVGDLKEFYHIGREASCSQSEDAGYPENVWPDEVPEFRDHAINLFEALETLGHHMLGAIFQGLGVKDRSILEATRLGNSVLRVAHYFGIDDPDSIPEGAVRAAPHGDINLITLLVGASSEGLELLRRDGTWWPVSVSPDTIVVNVGDMLERLTNGRLRSTIHRVVNPPRETLSEARLSMPFFMHPKASMDLSVIPSCLSDNDAKRYADISAGEFLDQRLGEIGLK